MRCLFLFGRDLRLHDHAGLAAAARIGEVVPACVQSPASIAHLERSPRRAAFYRGALASLANDLAARGTRLTVRSGARVATTLRLVREAKADAVVWSASYDAAGVADDRALQSALEEAGVRATIVHDALAVPPDDTAAARSEDGGRGYRALAPYVTAWLALPRDPIATHVTFAAHDLATEEITEPASYGGQELASEMATLARCEDFISGAILQYPFARNVPGSGETSRLSAALSFGLISARTILARIDERARDPFLLAEERLALKTFVRSLARRDFFLQLAWFFEEHADDALQPRMRAFPFAKDHPAVAAWREGRTGYPLVDAGMRQLRATGWMHPRVRSIAASFLCFDLGVDWRVGRDAWDRELVEDEPALATGNWQWVCGLGADLAQFPRIFNPIKQARAIDPRGAYVRAWVPELADVSDAELFANGRVRPTPQLTLALYERAPYPSPVVDHETAARDFLARYAAFVGGTGAKR